MDARISLNFSIAKVIAIFTVVAGHWFSPSILWIPVTVGLFIFAFSSGYFTSLRYGADLDIGRFWRNKLERLGVRYCFILGFLAVVVMLRGGTLFHWHTLVHFFGLSGVLNWLDIRNRSGLGAGLWFFTLLLVFYAVYPLLAKLCRSKRHAAVAAVTSTAMAIYLEEHTNIGHELWLTSLGFILGVAYGMQGPTLRAWPAAASAALGGTGLLVAHRTGFKGSNTTLIAITGIACTIWLANATRVNWRGFSRLARLEDYLLEIFLIHSYLFLHPSHDTLLDLSFSVIVIVAVAAGLHRTGNWISSKIVSRRATASA
ncbi:MULTISPECIES: acyltransferase family protein [unclassified Duganella]|uniref:acyltransferase family protein n=1 Tax=unclassified Duganella TaxID=2636909 RepID=UPI00131464A8|nr:MULTISPECIES: acyltransferase family protein [unclassified Duganella]